MNDIGTTNCTKVRISFILAQCSTESENNLIVSLILIERLFKRGLKSF
jgi:hypothetical protein